MATEKRYSDLDFRLKKLSSGDFNKVTDENAINQSLTSLFNTLPGERLFNLSYGTNIPFLLFDPFDKTTASSIINEINDSIQKYEGARIEIEDLNIELDYGNSRYNISLSYIIKSTTETGELELILPKR